MILGVEVCGVVPGVVVSSAGHREPLGWCTWLLSRCGSKSVPRQVIATVIRSTEGTISGCATSAGQIYASSGQFALRNVYGWMLGGVVVGADAVGRSCVAC